MQLIQWMIDTTYDKLSGYGWVGLFILSFAESSFFPVPVETLLIPLIIAAPSHAFWFILVAIIGSVIGGIFGYYIGYIGEIAVLERLFDKKKIDKIHKIFEKHGAIGIFIAGFTPIPYKVATIGAGVFYIDIWKFIIVSIISRSLRFILVGALVFFYGQAIVEFLDTYIFAITVSSGVLIILGYIYYQTRQ